MKNPFFLSVFIAFGMQQALAGQELSFIGKTQVGNTLVQVKTRVIPASPSAMPFKMQQNAGEPCTQQPDDCSVSLQFQAGSIESVITIYDSSGKLLKTVSEPRKPLVVFIERRDASDPRCERVPSRFVETASTEGFGLKSVYGQFGMPKSSIAVALRFSRSAQVDLDFSNSTARVSDLGEILPNASFAYYYQDSKDRAQGSGATLKRSWSVELMKAD